MLPHRTMASMLRFHRSIRLVGVVVALLLAACQPTTDDSTPSAEALPTQTHVANASAPASATANDDGEERSVFDVEGGDCFSASGDQVETVTVVDCEDPHIYEVFAVFDHEADAGEVYPGDDAILEYADAGCQPLFEDYVRIDYQTSIYWITSVTPSQATWDEGDDREIVCALTLGEEGTETTGSAEGSGE